MSTGYFDQPSPLRTHWILEKSRFTFLTICYYHIITGCQVSSVDKFINRSGALLLITAGISPCSIQASATWRGADAGTSHFHPSDGEGGGGAKLKGSARILLRIKEKSGIISSAKPTQTGSGWAGNNLWSTILWFTSARERQKRGVVEKK